jgi:PTH2 family peptidyl-tRNA hydrolase
MSDIADQNLAQVIVAQGGLNMRKGKFGAQAAHASWAALLEKGEFRCTPEGTVELVIPLDAQAHAWLSGQSKKKICLKVDNEAQLLDLFSSVKAAGLRCALIQDHGLTEFGGVPTYTAMAIGPHPKALIDPFTQGLALY